MWYYTLNGVQQGPVDVSVIQQMLASGQLTAQESVWREGMGAWAPVTTIPEFSNVQPQQMQQPQSNYGAQPAYPGAPMPGQAYSTPQPQGTGLAITALVMGILAIPGACLPCVGLIFGILAIIFALVNKNPEGKGLAKAGLICGIVGLALALVWWIINIVILVNNR